MNVTTYARGMAAYNQWMNDKLYACADELTDEERKRDLGAFFKSIHGTLNHLYVADEAFMQRFHGEPVSMKSADEIRFDDFAALRDARRILDQRISRWAEEVTDEFTDQDFRFQSVAYRQQMALPGWAMVLQMFNHQTHHRGQVTTLLTQLGKDPGVTDIPKMPGMLKP